MGHTVDPPLRAKSDRKALRAALVEGIIDSIRSDHRSGKSRDKRRRIRPSPNGMSGISSVFPVILSACEKVDITRVIDSISNANRRVFNIPEVHIVVPSAKLTLFNLKAQHICPGVSRSNNPWKTMDELRKGLRNCKRKQKLQQLSLALGTAKFIGIQPQAHLLQK